MEPAKIKGHTAILGEAQGFTGLPVRYCMFPGLDPEHPGQDAHCIQSEWKFSDEERARIASGDNLILTVMGKGQPPVILHVETPSS